MGMEAYGGRYEHDVVSALTFREWVKEKVR